MYDVCYKLNVSFPDHERHHLTEFVMFEAHCQQLLVTGNKQLWIIKQTEVYQAGY